MKQAMRRPGLRIKIKYKWKYTVISYTLATTILLHKKLHYYSILYSIDTFSEAWRPLCSSLAYAKAILWNWIAVKNGRSMTSKF